MTDQPMTPDEFARALNRYWPPYGDDDELVVRGELLAAYRALWEAWQAANNDALMNHVGAYDLALPGETAEQCRDRMREANAEAIARACRPVEEIEAGPTSAVNASDSDAWELSRRECPCKDCKGKGNLPCDECGVTERA